MSRQQDFKDIRRTRNYVRPQSAKREPAPFIAFWLESRQLLFLGNGGGTASGRKWFTDRRIVVY